MPFSPCWKYSNLRLNRSALFIALFIIQAIATTGMLADKPNTNGTAAPTLLEMLKGIIMPK